MPAHPAGDDAAPAGPAALLCAAALGLAGCTGRRARPSLRPRRRARRAPRGRRPAGGAIYATPAGRLRRLIHRMLASVVRRSPRPWAWAAASSTRQGRHRDGRPRRGERSPEVTCANATALARGVAGRHLRTRRPRGVRVQAAGAGKPATSATRARSVAHGHLRRRIRWSRRHQRDVAAQSRQRGVSDRPTPGTCCTTRRARSPARRTRRGHPLVREGLGVGIPTLAAIDPELGGERRARDRLRHPVERRHRHRRQLVRTGRSPTRTGPPSARPGDDGVDRQGRPAGVGVVR